MTTQTHLPVVPLEALARLLSTLQAAKAEDWRNLRDYALIVLASDTGLVGQALAQLDEHHLKLGLGVAWSTSPKHPWYSVVFSRQAAHVLCEWTAVRASLLLTQAPDLRETYGRTPIFRGPDRVEVTPEYLSKRLKGWQKRAGTPPPEGAQPTPLPLSLARSGATARNGTRFVLPIRPPWPGRPA